MNYCLHERVFQAMPGRRGCEVVAAIWRRTDPVTLRASISLRQLDEALGWNHPRNVDHQIKKAIRAGVLRKSVGEDGRNLFEWQPSAIAINSPRKVLEEQLC